MYFFSSLFSPIEVGNITIKNRLVMPAMSVNFGVDKDGYVTEQLTEYFATRARSGTGMLIVGGGGVDPIGHELPGLPALWNKKCISYLKTMTKKVKSFGSIFGMQIMHGGRQTYGDEKEAPSAIPALAVVKGIPRELTLDRIYQLEESFGNSAKYCEEAGFDFIEIHAAHGYLISQFMSPISNNRNDEYGGSFENRVRFLIKIIKNIKKKTFNKFPIGVRINGDDYIDGGWKLEDAIKLVPILEREGIDYLHVSGGIYGSSQLTIPSMYVAQGCFLYLAEAIKKVASIPVIGVGRIRDVEFANQQIYSEKVDMIAMGRSHLADQELAKKAIKGDIKAIRPCIGCCLGCIDRVLALESATCVVNPKLGREYILKNKYKTKNLKKIVVLGSGIAGLTVSRKMALRGHNVVILEKNGYIGGSTKIASFPPGRSDIMDIIFYLENELNRLGVEIRLNVSLIEKNIDEIMPNIVLIATGALPIFPIINGLSKTAMNLYNPVDILKNEVILGHKIIILGGNQVGLILADYLSVKNKEVIVLHRGNHFAEEMASNDRFYLRKRLYKSKVFLYKNINIIRVFDDGVLFRSKNNLKKLTGYNDLVISEKLTPIRELGFFDNKGIKYKIIGDARLPGGIMQSIDDGESLADMI